MDKPQGHCAMLEKDKRPVVSLAREIQKKTTKLMDTDRWFPEGGGLAGVVETDERGSRSISFQLQNEYVMGMRCTAGQIQLILCRMFESCQESREGCKIQNEDTKITCISIH